MTADWSKKKKKRQGQTQVCVKLVIRTTKRPFICHHTTSSRSTPPHGENIIPICLSCCERGAIPEKKQQYIKHSIERTILMNLLNQ